MNNQLKLVENLGRTKIGRHFFRKYVLTYCVEHCFVVYMCLILRIFEIKKKKITWTVFKINVWVYIVGIKLLIKTKNKNVNTK